MLFFSEKAAKTSMKRSYSRKIWPISYMWAYDYEKLVSLN